MHLHRGLTFIAITLTTLVGPELASAATANCMSADGECQVSNDGFDMTDCMCADGSGGGGGGGNMWAGLSEVELGPICQEQLAAFCGPFVPPDYVECFDVLGYCNIDNDPEDLLHCECTDGSTGDIVGGMAWAGYSDPQLLAECEAQLALHCVPPPMSLVCSNPNGECTIANVPDDFLACECNDGSLGALGGGNAWAGYSELQLYGECGNQLVGLCGGPLPPPPWIECGSRLGSCIIDNDPQARLECTCTGGEMITGGEGEDWSALSDQELFMMCEEALYEGCAPDGGSDSGDTADTGETGDTGDTGAASSTGEPGTDTGSGDSGTTSETSDGPPPSTTTGEDSSGGSTEGNDGGAAGDEGGCSCSAADGSGPAGWGLVSLGLLGMTRRRRRASIRR